MKPASGVSDEALNSARDVAGEAVKEGASDDEAIARAIKYLRRIQTLSTLDDARVRGWLEKELEDKAQTLKSDTKSPTPISSSKVEVDMSESSVLYRMVAPGRFAPVPKRTATEKFAGVRRKLMEVTTGFSNKLRWKGVIGGVVLGLAVGFCLCYLLGQRYKIERFGPNDRVVIRIDTWTGRSWTSTYSFISPMTWQPVQEPPP